MFKLKSLILLLLLSLVASPVFAQGPTFTVSVSETKELGKFLVGKNGMTLYSFTPDPLNVSVCYDTCATAWPPLLVDSADKLTVADGILGKFGTTTRKDNTLQVTYNGIPLYYWFKDVKAGDTTGHRVGRVWWVVPPATVYTQPIPKLGTILVGPTGMTLYIYTKDTPDMSTCYDACATAWPPLTVKTAADFIPGINLPGKFNTITRTDGTLQVTYNGMPLYYWAKDKALGDATGEGVGKVWYTVVPETVAASNTKELGDFLITADGMTLYAFAKDTAGVSNCSGDCIKTWPPFTLSDTDRLAVGPTIKGKLDTIKRDDKSLQVTYNGIPLYLYKSDHKPGDATGQGVGNVWAVVKP